MELWTHECLRVFSDRLADDTDRQWFYKHFNEHLTKQFEMNWDVEMYSNFLYGDYINFNKDYCKILFFDELPSKFVDHMVVYNTMMTKELNLVFF